MPGSITYTPTGVEIAGPGIPVSVYRYSSDGGDDDEGGSVTLLPNVRCEQVQYKEGLEPPTAQFSYILDEIAASVFSQEDGQEWPTQFDQIWPIARPESEYVVGNGDEIVAIANMPDDSTRVLFHGFARVPQTDVSPDGQSVTFAAAGVAIRCWENPIGGRIQRDGSDPQEGDWVLTHLPTRFNPAGTDKHSIGGILPNCTPDNTDEDEDSDYPWPLFLDPTIDRSPDPRTFWDLAKVVRYILANYNTIQKGSDGESDQGGADDDGDPDPAPDDEDTPPPAPADGEDDARDQPDDDDDGGDDEDELLVDNPDFGVLANLLQDREPADGAQFFDPTDPSTYTTSPNYVRDYDATNKAWPDAISELLGFYGFGARFVCEDDGDAEPYNYIEIYRKDASGPTDPKEVFLPPTATLIADQPVNISEFHAGFDYHSVFNDVYVETHPKRYEVSVILAPGFQPNSGDGNASTRTQFTNSALQSSGATADQRIAYRYYIADECGDGHYSVENQDWITPTTAEEYDVPLAFDFDPVMPPNDVGDSTWVERYRPGSGKLFTKDANNKPFPAQLDVSRDYGDDGGKDGPCLWDGESGTWQQIGSGTWDLLPDRLGIMVTADDPEQWKIGKPKTGQNVDGVPWPCQSGVLSGITSMANPTETDVENPGESMQFWLRLTTVIEGDEGIGVEAARRDASPLPFTVQRRVDATDHFYYDVVDTSSEYYEPGIDPEEETDSGQTIVQDDTGGATSRAVQLRTAHEFPPLTATLTIPMLDFSLDIGDRISTINGRNVSLQVNAGAEQLEPPSYPFVVSKTWDLRGDHQATTYQLSDRRHEPSPMHGKH